MSISCHPFYQCDMFLFHEYFSLQKMSHWGHSLIVNPYADDPIISESQTFSEISQESHWSDDGKEPLGDSPEEIPPCYCDSLLLAVFQTRKGSLFAARP